jgi:solute carrier family 25 (mitochondrial S-adenosylmethionine transporter), member 26
LNCAVVAPAEVLKQNAQMLTEDDRRKMKSSPTVKVMRHLAKHPAKLWRGYTALVARDLPFTVLQFPAFEYLKRTITTWRSSQNDGRPITGVFERAKISAVSAAIAGSAAAWVTTPFDVVKTRMMLEAGAKSPPKSTSMALEAAQGGATRKSALQICKEAFQNEGIKGLFRGGSIRAGWTIVGNGLFMGCYDGAKFYLEDQRQAAKEDGASPSRKAHRL